VTAIPTLVRVVSELLWTLRREGFAISVAQAIDVARAIRAVGFANRETVRHAVACIVVRRPRERKPFAAAFDAFFAAVQVGENGSLWEKLAAEGFSDAELDVLRAFLAGAEANRAAPLRALATGVPPRSALTTLASGGADLDRLLAASGLAHSIDAHSRPELGFRAHHLLRSLGSAEAHRTLGLLRAALAGALGERGTALAEAVARALGRGEDRVHAFVRRLYDARLAAEADLRAEGRPEDVPFSSFAALSDADIDEVRRAVRRLAERLRAGARIRFRHAQRGAIDPRRVLRSAMRTGGAPSSIPRKRRHRRKPKLIVLCDVSDSVRAAASFLLEFTYAAQELFDGARSFVFVSDLGEVTDLFAHQSVRHAVGLAWAGAGVVRAAENSNYGRVLRLFEAQVLRDVDRRTTVVILGDGRTNYLDAAADVLDRVRLRARALLWFCPEPRGLWSQGDSAMLRYAPKCTAVHEVTCAADLERAARALLSRGARG
jgi:uncharacterized protein with von Willebrand factor type A (vWA) domain